MSCYVALPRAVFYEKTGGISESLAVLPYRQVVGETVNKHYGSTLFKAITIRASLYERVFRTIGHSITSETKAPLNKLIRPIFTFEIYYHTSTSPHDNG